MYPDGTLFILYPYSLWICVFFVVVVCHLSISVPHAIYRLCISFIETKSGEYRVNKSIPTFFFFDHLLLTYCLSLFRFFFFSVSMVVCHSGMCYLSKGAYDEWIPKIKWGFKVSCSLFFFFLAFSISFIVSYFFSFRWSSSSTYSRIYIDLAIWLRWCGVIVDLT